MDSSQIKGRLPNRFPLNKVRPSGFRSKERVGVELPGLRPWQTPGSPMCQPVASPCSLHRKVRFFEKDPLHVGQGLEKEDRRSGI